MEELLIREARPGEPSLVVHFYYKLFEEQFGFLPNTEQYFLHAMEGYFHEQEDSALYVIEKDGKIAGSVCIVKLDEHEAQLRLFGTADSVQGKGMGYQLMQAAMDFCREREYHHVILWTIDICRAARHLYSKFGFVHTADKPNDTWADYHMTEELWEYNG